jgi:hypothetical protein
LPLLLGRDELVAPCGREPQTRVLDRGRCRFARRFGVTCLLFGLGERSRRDRGRARRAGTPRGRTAEPVAFARHRDHAGIGERDIERGRPPALDEHERRQQPCEDAIEAGPSAPHARRQRSCAGKRQRRLCAVATETGDEQ